MTKKTTVLCNCVGPYLAHGFNIIEACLSEGAHYTDLCGEVPWIRQVVQKYHERAKEKELKIVPSCGFDSIPSDLGVFLLQKESEKRGLKAFQDIILYVERSKGTLSGGTAAAMVGNFEFAQKFKREAKESALRPLPKRNGERSFSPRFKRSLHEKRENGWSLLTAGINTGWSGGQMPTDFPTEKILNTKKSRFTPLRKGQKAPLLGLLS